MIAILAKPIEPQPFVPYIPNSTASLDSRRITYSLDAFESTSVPVSGTDCFVANRRTMLIPCLCDFL